MSGYNTVRLVHRVEESSDNLGLRVCQTRHEDRGSFGSTVTLKPKDTESLPIFSRDAEIFQGTLEEVLHFLRGIEWAREYDAMLKVSSVESRKRKEQNVRNKQLMDTIKNSDVKLGSAA